MSIELRDTVLTVRGERKRPGVAEGASYVHEERPFGAFERPVTVPDGVDPDRITASLVDGVLSLVAPKPQRMRRKAISIVTGAEQHRLETAAA